MAKVGRDSFHFSFELGDGSTIFFWHDRWCGEVPLKEVYPGLYVLAVDRNASIADYGLTDASCAKGMSDQRIICCSIVSSLGHFGN